jgi:TetR/AcrR family fatty acid metabolism transcriptional regulator
MAEPRPTQRRLPRDQRVALIMETAREVFREKGSEQFLTAEVAERCGISEGTIYKYFPTKRDLLIQVAEAWFEEFLDEQPPYSSARSTRDRLYHLVWSNLALIRREKALTRFVLMELRSDPNYRTLRIYELNRRIAAQVTELVQEGINSGVFRANISLRLVRDVVFGAIEHQTWAYLRGEGDFSVEESAEGITDLVYCGIAAHAVDSAPDIQSVATRLERVAASLERTAGVGAPSDNAKPDPR